MSRSLNRAELIGHLGNDIEVKFTPSGIQKGTFNVATTRRWKDQKSSEWKEETDWHRCVFWRCDNVAQFLTKGKQVFISGRLQTRNYDDKDGIKRYLTEIICEELMLLGGGQQQTGSSAPGHQAARPQANAPATGDVFEGQGVTDDDVPF